MGLGLLMATSLTELRAQLLVAVQDWSLVVS
jgi:hypothetical protein